MKKIWWKEAVVYQIYPRSFMDSNGDGFGDLRGIISKVDYLKELGIDTVWLNPVYKSPQDDNGYDISDYRNILEAFGTLEDFKELLSLLHKNGIRLIMDLVVNHSSDEHNWFVESRKSKDNKYRDYYIWRDGKNGKEPNNWTSFFSGKAWEYDEQTDQYYLHLFSKKQPDLNWENPQLRQEVYDLMNYWLEMGIDGFRMDVINMISKVQDFPDSVHTGGSIIGGEYYSNGPRLHEFLQEMHANCFEKFNNAMTVGEAGATAEIARLLVGEDRNELNMLIHFEHMGWDTGDGELGKWERVHRGLPAFKEIFTRWHKVLHNIGWNSLYLSNHDQPRFVSRFGNDTTYRVESAKMLATMLFTMQGTPFVYQGDELGTTNAYFTDIKDYRDIETLNMWKDFVETRGYDPEKMMKAIHFMGRDNARTPMQWDDSENAGFTTGTPWIKVNPRYKEINAKNAMADENSVFHYYKKLIRLRKENEVAVYGDFTEFYNEHEALYVYLRTLEGSAQKLLVCLNFSDKQQSFVLPKDIKFKTSKLYVSNYENDGEAKDKEMKPYEAVAYLLD